MTPDYYAILGIEPRATPRDIQVAYRRGVLACHPDRDPSPEALARSQKLGEAYAILRDPMKRHKYDLELVYERGFPRPDSDARPPDNRNYGSTVRTDFRFTSEDVRNLFEELAGRQRANGHLSSCTCRDCRPGAYANPFAADVRAMYSTPGHNPKCACSSCEHLRDVYTKDSGFKRAGCDDEGNGL